MMIPNNYEFIVVTPVYEDLEASRQLFHELGKNFGNRVFIVAVDDGSLERPLTTDSLIGAGVNGVVLKLLRNVGHQRAIAVGLDYASTHMHPSQNIVVMDSDGEDLPQSISVLLAELDESGNDVAVAQRKRRIESIRFKVFYNAYKRLFRIMTGRFIDFGNFMVLRHNAVRRLVTMQELSIHVAGAVLASKLRISVCPLDRGQRYAGSSKMNFVALSLHGFRALMVFAEDVLVRVGIACAIFAGLAIVGAIAAITLKLIGISTPGWFSIALGILVLMLMQMGAIALMTLMLSGVVRGVSVVAPLKYRDFVDLVMEASSQK